MDISVLRIKSILHGNALHWSEDGDLALCAIPNVVIYSPLDYEKGKPLEWLRRDLPEPSTFPIKAGLPTTSAISASDPQHPYVVSARWSPTGLSATAGCFLTYLTSKHQLLLLSNSGQVGKTDWNLLVDMAEHTPSPITCFDWSHKGWGSAELVVGTASSGVYSFEIVGAVPHVKEHFELQGKVKNLRCADGRIYAQTQVYSQSTLHILGGGHEEFALEPGYVSCIHADADGVLVAQPNRVTEYPSGKVTNTGIPESVVGFVGTTKEWTAVSQKGATYGPAEGPATGPREFNLQKRGQNTTVHGVVEHPDRSAAVFLVSARPSDQLFFPSVKLKTCTLSFKSLRPPDFSQTHFSPRALWASSYLFNRKQPVTPEASVPSIKTLDDLVLVLGATSLATYFGAKDNSTALRIEIANFLFENYSLDSGLSPIDRAILTSYGRYNNKQVECPAEIEISSGFLRETFDFSGQRDKDTIESTCGHKWKRCCITLLPIFSMDTLASTNNQFTVLTPFAAEHAGSTIAKSLLGLPLCIFNGCRYYVRVSGTPRIR